jgi:two-component system phosphate regulon sensor histidine kinase PhoR
MKKSTIWLLATVMFVTFFALLQLQVRYMGTSIEIRTQQFNEQVIRSLRAVMRDLERDQTREFLIQAMAESGFSYLTYSQIRTPPGFIGQTSTAITHSGRGETRTEHHITSQSIRYSRTISGTLFSLQETMSTRFQHEQALLGEVIHSVLHRSNVRPIEERIDFRRLYFFIQNELAYNGLAGIPFHFQVVNTNNEAVYTSPGFSTRYRDAVHTQPLFPNDPSDRLNMLRVFFPTQREYIDRELAFFVPSMIFMVILLFTFLFTVITLFRQKRLSEMKNDFINNMTHELKTPVSTISLASQMLKDNSILKSPEVFKHVTGVINDETKRLSFQVEKVLQMSLFDRQKSTLKPKEIDANDLVVNVANTHALKVEKYGGTLDIDLQAVDSTIKVDEMHFTNVLFNLLDNAVKYRKENVPLELMIRTHNEGNRIIISVEDNGIGIRKEDAKKVFDRFYRVHTGNRHDVKGFGLGLAYVKKIVTDLNGTIRVEGELGKGSKFIISLPVIIQK